MVVPNDEIELTHIPTYNIHKHYIYMQEIDGEYHPAIEEAHRHEFFEILWFTKAGGEHIVDFKSYPIHKNELFFLAPGKVHSLNTYEKEGYLIILSEEFVSELLCASNDCFFSLFYTLGKGISLRLADEEELKLNKLFFLFFEEYKEKLNDRRLLQSYCRAFLLYAQRMMEKQNLDIYSENKDRIGLLHSLIEQHYKSEKLVAFYALKLDLTTKRLNELCKESIGFTVSQVIHKRIIIEAKRELYFNKSSINQIAYHLGYSDPAYFSRFFKKETGTSPKVYQNLNK